VAGHDSIDVDKFIQIKKTQGEFFERQLHFFPSRPITFLPSRFMEVSS